MFFQTSFYKLSSTEVVNFVLGKRYDCHLFYFLNVLTQFSTGKRFLFKTPGHYTTLVLNT